MPDTNVRQIKILISSTRADLAQYREEAARIIKKIAAEKEKQVQLVDVSMEKETQSGDREFAVAVSKRWVEEVDWVVIIVGWNYGTISDETGADGLSVTEWEYRYALERHKDLFVFMAGDPGDPNQYRVSEEEREDLKDWILNQDKQDPEKIKKLDTFRKELSKAYIDRFAHLNMFRARLEKTLKDAIDKFYFNIQPGTPLAELIVTVTPHIRDCIRKVKLIAKCKQIHDYLHELLQYVLRPLREEVLSKWEQEGTLSVSGEKVIWGRVNCASRQLGGMREVSKAIGPELEKLRNSVDKILDQPDLWNENWNSSDSRPRREAFTEVMEKFAGYVQHAFSQADSSMKTEEDNLRDCYSALLESLKHARQQTKLSPNDDQRIDQELKTVEANRSCLRKSLTTHHQWQEAHDKLHELDSFRETTRFDKQLNFYRETWLPELLDLIEKELNETGAHQAGSAEPEQGADTPDVRQAPPPLSPGSRPACGALVDNLRSLKGCLEELRQGDSAFAFDNLCKPFDDAFYCVDKRTVEEVSGAEMRAVALAEWLDELARGTRQKGN